MEARQVRSLRAACLLPVLLLALSFDAERPADVAPEEAVRRCLREGRYAEAESRAKAILESAEGRSGVDSLQAADALDLLVESMWRHGRGSEPDALKLAERAVSIREAHGGDRDPALAVSLKNLGTLQSSAADFSGAMKSLDRAIALRTAAADNAPELASCRERMATVLGNSGRYGVARALLDLALRELPEDSGEGRAEAAQILTTLGAVLTNAGEQEEARAALDRALGIRQEIYGADHPEVAATLYRQAILMRKTGDLHGAAVLAERSLDIRRRTLAPGCPDIAATIGALADIRSDEGRLQEARGLHEQALQMREAALGPRHPVVAAGLKNLGSVLSELGRYADAREVIERALAIEEERLGPEHPQVALTLSNLGGVVADLGDLSEARAMLERAAGIQQRTLRAGHPQYAGTMLNLAAVLEDVGERDEARARLEKALEILEGTLGKNDPVVASVLLRLGESYLNARQFDRARAVLERARGILEAQPVLPHSRLGRMLNVLGRLMNDSGDPGAAIPLYDAAQAAIAEELGAAHPLAAENLRDRAVARRRVGDEAGSLDDALAAERIARAGLLEFSRFLSEREALRYLEVRTKGLDLALSLLTAEKGSVGDTARVQQVWNEVVQSRAVVLDELAFRHRAALESGSPGIPALAGDLEAARRRLFRLMRTDTDPEESQTDRARLDTARRDVERTERALAADSALFREAQAHNEIALADVVQALPSGIALVAYVRYERQPPAASTSADSGGPVPSYLAFVATGGQAPPQAVSLGPAQNIEDRVREWRQEVSTAPLDLAAMARYRRAGERLSQAIWQPVASRLGTARIVLVVPDGEISFVSLATLPVGADKYLVEEGPLLQYLSAERDLVPDPEHAGEGVGLLVVGGPDYDAPPARGGIPSSPRPGAAGGPGAASTHQESQTSLAASGRCRDLAALRFDPLPSALAEAGEVARRWRRESGRKEGKPKGPEPAGPDSRRPAVSTLAGATATEAAFKAGAPGRDVLHLATHGFFVPARCGATLEDSLLAAGLAMAGANRSDAALPEGADDGLLTAEEIASLDLRSVRWAVLSACDTGLGQVHAGEGVLGLRRAFQIAGVDTLIMSLWSVEDHSAREWVRRLYRYRGEGLSTVEAMSRADRSVIDERRKAGIVTHPFYWGAFVAAGDWR